MKLYPRTWFQFTVEWWTTPDVYRPIVPAVDLIKIAYVTLALRLRGWRMCAVEMPPLDVPVLTFNTEDDAVRVLERRKEWPGHEDVFAPYDYWDDPYNDGQDLDSWAIVAWRPLPKFE